MEVEQRTYWPERHWGAGHFTDDNLATIRSQHNKPPNSDDCDVSVALFALDAATERAERAEAQLRAALSELTDAVDAWRDTYTLGPRAGEPADLRLYDAWHSADALLNEPAAAEGAGEGE